MSRVVIENQQLIITMHGARKLLALKSELSVPLSSVKSVTAGLQWKDTPKPLEKRFGANGFGYFGGTFAQHGNKVFYDIRKKEDAIVITLKNEDFESLVIGVDNPDETVALINDALRKV